MESLTERIRILESQGYVNNFGVRNGQLCIGRDIMFSEENVNLDSTYRIEAASDPDSQSIVYALTCTNPKSKGLLINSFGIYSDADIDKFIQKIR